LLGLQIWDTPDQEVLKSLRNMSYPDTDIFMIGYDMTRKNTLESVVAHDLNDLQSYQIPDPDPDDEDDFEFNSWVSEALQGCESDFHIILVGCKADYWEELNASGTPEQKAELTTWQQGYDVPPASHLRFVAFT
jgi:GTPase SAR1 family protein